ncbi:MAG: radical SAM/SPASM domain-containing protein [Bacteroidia bacterium]|nr:radical SAM/SPASM domain-containing protein [Bacteroidia bacterium]
MIERFIKPANVILAGYSYLKSSISGKVTVNGMPVSISAELTNNCNLHCPECSSGSGQMQRDRGFMDIELFNMVMKGIGTYLYNVNLYFQGEPMLHPLFFSFVRNSRNTHTVVSTNGHFLSEENSEKLVKSGLSKLIISLDGIDQDTYSAYRINGSVNTVLDGIRNVADAKMRYNSPLKIEIQFLVNRLNENQIPQIRQMAARVKASLSLKSMQVINKEDIGSWLPLNGRFRRYKMKNREYIIKNSLPNRCARLWFNPVITWDGKVIPCCFDKNAEYAMGDLNHDSFREIWDGPKYRIFRKSVLSGRQMIEICRNCTSGLRGVIY